MMALRPSRDIGAAYFRNRLHLAKAALPGASAGVGN